MIRPDHSARGLHPRHEALSMRKIPAHLDRRNAGTGIRPADSVRIAALSYYSRASRAADALKLRRVRLPERKDLDRVLQVALQHSLAMLRGNHLTQMPTHHQEAEIRSVLQSDATLQQRAVLPWSARSYIRYWRYGYVILRPGGRPHC